MAVPNRGLKNIRTLSGRVDAGALPYRGYMQITCLEMEKVRRSSERNSAARRIREIDLRLQEIEQEKQLLLAAIGSSGALASRRLPGIEVRPSARPSTRGFRIRY